MNATQKRIAELVNEQIAIVPYDVRWPALFEAEQAHLQQCLPKSLVRRIEHFGSTAVPGLDAKPIIDMLVEVTDLEATRERIVPVLTGQGYEYFWRPSFGDDEPPFYAWFIKRDRVSGVRSHHIHMVEAGFTHMWERLLFRDYLLEYPQVANEYARLKRRLAEQSPHDRQAYTQGKTRFVTRVTAEARQFYLSR